MKIVLACGQFAPVPGALRRNIESMRTLARQAAAAGAGILVLPELCLCGYPTAEAARGWAVPAQGPQVGQAAACARDLGIALCFGFAEAGTDNRLHNSMAFVDRTGSLRAVYRKVHLWITEKEWATPGSGFPSLVDGALQVGMWICYDTRFPETTRTLARAGATVGLVGSAWFGPPDEWELAVRARALDNGIYVAGASVLGSFGAAPFRGASLIADPHGRVLARAREGVEEVICAEYDDGVVQSFRSRLPLLADLRPGAYA